MGLPRRVETQRKKEAKRNRSQEEISALNFNLLIPQDNDNELQNIPLEGIIISNQSLVLQNITRQRMGQYVCTASNSEGDGFSQPVQLNVQREYQEFVHGDVHKQLCIATVKAF
jgi:hypothetical protein